MKALLRWLAPGMALGLVSSCTDFNQPLDSSYDPLDGPGARRSTEVVEVGGPSFKPGQWLETTIPGTAFYASVPKGNEQPRRTLSSGTILKVIATDGTYVQVETESGEVGYVPAIMVAERPTASTAGGELPIVPVNPALSPDPISSPDGLAPEPEVAPIDVEDAAPPRIDPGAPIE